MIDLSIAYHKHFVNNRRKFCQTEVVRPCEKSGLSRRTTGCRNTVATGTPWASATERAGNDIGRHDVKQLSSPAINQIGNDFDTAKGMIEIGML